MKKKHGGIGLDKKILEQFKSVQEEIDDIIRRRNKIRKEIQIIFEERPCVSDSVSCGRKGKKPLQVKTISGFPYPEWKQKIKKLRNMERKLSIAQTEQESMLNSIEDYIQSIQNPMIRRMFRYKYIDGFTWKNVAEHMGKGYTADGCRKAHDRFLKK